MTQSHFKVNTATRKTKFSVVHTKLLCADRNESARNEQQENEC